MNNKTMVLTALILATIYIFLILCSITRQDRQDESEEYPQEYAEQEGYHSRDWGGDDSERLAKAAMRMAADDDEKTKMLVMLVVINRVWSERFPDTIDEAIIQLAGEGYDKVIPNEECYRAADRIQYDGWDESQGALHFCLSEDMNADEDMHCNGYEFLYSSGKYNFYE